MAVGATHPDSDAALATWERARDVLAGEDAVKAEGTRYLLRLDSQSEEEYAAYKARASFFGATARTLEEYLDMVFRRAPVTSIGSSAALVSFASDCDRWGTEFAQYARRVVSEVLSVGRGGSLVLADGDTSSGLRPPSPQSGEGGRPCVSYWRAEDVLDWCIERIGGRSVLTRLVLKDGARRRQLRIVDSECVQEVWNQVDGEWVMDGFGALRREDVALFFIPFVFHGPKGSLPERSKLPLADIIAANLDHYRLDADYKHGLHFAALPTAWVSGFDKAAPLRFGSSAAWVSEVPGASAGFLEFTGAGLAHLERAMEKVERRMALLGARMTTSVVANGLPAGDGSGCSSDGGDLSGLGAIVGNLNRSLSRLLQVAQWCVQGGDLDAIAGRVGFAMNTDLGARAMSGEEITAVVAAWRAGAISRDTMLDRLKRGEVLPDGRTVAQERALIHRVVERRELRVERMKSSADQRPSQPTEHSALLLGRGVQARVVIFAQDALAEANGCLRDGCQLNKSCEIGMRLPRASLCDIGGDRDRCSPHLIRQAESLLDWEGACQGVHQICEIDRLLPNIQPFEVEHRCLSLVAQLSPLNSQLL